MKQRIVTVVGGTGFLGRYVVKELARLGISVQVVCRNPESEHALALKTMGAVGQIVLSRADITDAASIRHALEESHHPFAVVNLVGKLFERGEQTFAAVHAQGAEKLAQTAKAVGVHKFVHVSALGVGQAAGAKYARTKIMGEKAVMAAFPDATILRPSVVFGPEDNFFNQFARMAVVSPFLPLIDGGKTKFQPVYAGDVAKAAVSAIQGTEAKGQMFELGGPKVYTFREILEYVLKETGREARFIDIPLSVAAMLGRLLEWLPRPPLTYDQVRLLQYDNIVTPGAPSLADLGVTPTAVEAAAPGFLRGYRKVRVG